MITIKNIQTLDGQITHLQIPLTSERSLEAEGLLLPTLVDPHLSLGSPQREKTPQHLSPTDPYQADFLWEALNSGIIETIGSGYRVEERERERLLWQGANFDFLNPIFLLPLLLTAYHEKKITLENIVRLTKANLYDIFKLERKEADFILVALEQEHTVQRINQTQSNEIKLKGWPVYILINDHLFQSPVGGYHLTRIE